jgi:hypothetical protein
MAWSDADLARILAQPGYRVLTPPAPLPDKTPEETLLAKIRGFARAHGYLTYHTHNSQRSEPGFPDLVLTNGARVLMYELKDNRSKLTVEQDRWLALLAYSGKVECGVWRPRDWPHIVATLSQKGARP